MNQGRANPRQRVYKNGTIVYNGGTSTRTCLIRDLSASGARISLHSTIGIPNDFLLMFANGSRYFCTVKWRKLTGLGVEYRDDAT